MAYQNTMFWLFKRKNVNTDKVSGFDWGIKAIKKYIQMSDWVNARIGIEEIIKKETASYNKLIEDIEKNIKDEKEKEKLLKIEEKNFQKKKDKIKSLKNDFEKKKQRYTSSIEKKLFEIRFKKIKNEVNKLLGKKEAIQAINLIKSFKNENIENSKVIDFYNAEQKKIQKVIEKIRKQEQYKIKQNTQFEALSLIWDVNAKKEEELLEKTEWGLFKRIKKKIASRRWRNESIKSKQILDEISLLLSEEDNMKQRLAEQRLQTIHQWLVKEIEKEDIIWYGLYWKILWANKISGDAFWIEETKDKYKLFIWDATGHWIKAWFIITLLNKLFNINYSKLLDDLVFDINNQLKQDLESKNFVTWIFFEIDKITNKVEYVWMWHEIMLVYRKKTKTIDRIIPGWIAMWIISMKDKALIKIKELNLDDWDILLVYSDWLIESKSISWEFYWLDKLEEAFKSIADYEANINKVYNYIIKDAKLFRWWSQFDDDLTLVLLKREADNDLVKEWDKYIEKMRLKEWLNEKEVRKLKWKTKKEVLREMEAIRKKKETKSIVLSLQNLYYTWEMLKLKEDATRYIKEGYVDKKINFYLKKAMENEMKYKINLKNQKMQAKFNVLNELYKKWDYETVIKEIQEVVAKDWNI